MIKKQKKKAVLVEQEYIQAYFNFMTVSQTAKNGLSKF